MGVSNCLLYDGFFSFAVAMKDGTGLDLLEKIRHKGLRTPFLLMSGDDSRTLEQKAKLYYGGFCCKTDFDLIRKIKALVSN